MTRAGGGRAKGERLKLQQVFCKKPFPCNCMVASLPNSISVSSHHGGQSAGCLGDQRGAREGTESLNPRAESAESLHLSQAQPQKSHSEKETGKSWEEMPCSHSNHRGPHSCTFFFESRFPKSITDDNMSIPRLSGAG